MKEKVSHNQVVLVLLVCVVALVEDKNCYLLHLYEAMHQKVMEFFGHRHENVVSLKLNSPSLQL
jgi:hypothetical protein